MADNAGFSWAIMGTETIATEHVVEAIRSVGHSPTWVVSRDIRYAQAFAGDLSIPNATDKLAPVCDDPSVKFVYVSAMVNRRPYYVEAAAKAGKHILCDGPICTSRKQAEDLVHLCDDVGVTLAVNHIARASNVHQTMKRLVQEGDIGKMQSLTIIRGGRYQPPPHRRIATSDTGNIYFDAAVESIDLARYLTGEEPEQLAGIAQVDAKPSRHLAFMMRMSAGCLVQSHESFATADIEDVIVVAGSDGVLVANGTLNSRGAGTLTRRIAGRNELIPIREGDMHNSLIRKFVSEPQVAGSWLSTGEDGIKNLIAIDALQKSVKTKRFVEFPKCDASCAL